MKVISLFAGAGGLEIAACSTGKVRRIVSTDANATFLETTRINMPQHFPKVRHEAICADARALKGDEIMKALGGRPDLVIGGPPCDDFTVNGLRRGLAGDKGPLIYEFMRLVEETNAPCFLFENVPNLARQFESAFRRLLEIAGSLGYQLAWDILVAANYGAPTLRKRVFVVGWKWGEPTRAFQFPLPTHGEQSVVMDLFPNTNAKLPYVLVSDVLRNLPDVKEDRGDVLNHRVRIHRPSTIRQLEAIPQGKKSSYRYRAPWEGLCPSLTAGRDDSTKAYIHPLLHREMTVREYARIHGFPDSWFFMGTANNGIKQIANAVPIPLGTAVTGMVCSFVEQYKAKTRKIVRTQISGHARKVCS